MEKLAKNSVSRCANLVDKKLTAGVTAKGGVHLEGTIQMHNTVRSVFKKHFPKDITFPSNLQLCTILY